MVENNDKLTGSKNQDESKNDDLNIIIEKVTENKDSIISFLDLLNKMQDAGLVDLFVNTTKDYTPTDIDFLVKFFSEKEMIETIFKFGNSMIGLLYGLSGERTSDLIKSISFNLSGVTDGFVDGVKNPEKLSTIKLYEMLKDPDISAFATGILNALSVIVSSTRKVP